MFPCLWHFIFNVYISFIFSDKMFIRFSFNRELIIRYKWLQHEVRTERIHICTCIAEMYIIHVERKVPKYKNHKIRERKVKTLTRNWRDHWGWDTRKLYRDILTGTAVFVNRKRVNVCEHTQRWRLHFPFPYFEKCILFLLPAIVYLMCLTLLVFV